MHKKLLSVVFIWLCALSSMADTLRIVEPFRVIEHASVLASYRNEFGSYRKPNMDVEFPYALIRVHIEGNELAVTKAKERFALYLGQHYTTKAKNTSHVNEIMFLVPVGAGHAELQCGDGCQPLVLFDNPRLAADAIYEGKVRYALEIKKRWEEPDPITKQYFKFRIHPADVAGITVLVTENGQQEPWNVADGIASRKLDYGVYHYVISADRYHKTEGTFTVSDTGNELDIHLRPQFGWLNVSGDNSAQGAYVFATNHSTGDVKQIGTIPLQNTELNAGAYSLRIQKTKYKDYLTTISIKEGETTSIRPVLEANFAQLTLAVQSGAEIWLDGNRLGTTSWTGTLELGEYAIEARQANHRSSYTQVVVSEQSVGKTIQLNNPKPIYGTFEVSGSPADAVVYVDGQKMGTTPLLVNKILIGSHKVRIEKEGYDKQEKMLTISEGQEAVMDYTLMKEVKPVLNNTPTTYNDKKNGQEKGVVVPKFPNERIKIGSLYYTATDDGTSVEVAKVPPDKKNYKLKKITIPAEISCKGYKYSVTSIGDSAFYWCYNLVSITIPNSVTSIGNLAFSSCYNLTSISVDKDNPIYDSRDNCNAIIETKTNTLIVGCKNTVIPNSVTSIGEGAFEDCDALTSITIPNSVTSIGKHAFCNCDALTSIIIPNSVTSIGRGVFLRCGNLASITIPNSVTSIGEYAFLDCPNLTSVTIPHSVTSIGEGAFCSCYNLTSITIPNSVTSIGNRAFEGCYNLTSITIPNSVTSIGRYVFTYCSKLTSIIVDKDNPKYDSRDNCNAIVETKTNQLIAGCKNTVIPNSVKSIGPSAFEGCFGLTSITIPNGVTFIGFEAFEYCPNLTSVTIPNSVWDIAGVRPFWRCDKLKTIYIPKGTKAKFAVMRGLEDHVDKLVEK